MKRTHTHTNWLTAMGVLTIVLVGFVAARYVDRPAASTDHATVTYRQDEPPAVSAEVADRALASANDLSIAFRVASEKVLPSVVAIETRVLPEAPEQLRGRGERIQPEANPFAGTPFEDMFRGFDMNDPRFRFSTPDMMPQTGLGSGVVIDASGLIMTNSHVVRGNTGRTEVTVRLQDGREFSAAQVWTDPQTDIAMIKIEGATGLIPAELGNSDQITVGDWVLALGQPFGLESTVTAGIISATHRGVGIAERENFLQTDAAINPGNSGGPLVNLQGEVVGINTAISSRSGSNSGVGFAVPINIAKWVGDQLASHGNVRRAFLGVGVQQIDASLAHRLGVQPRQGVIITQVHADTPAEEAGLKSGDVILDFAGLKIQTPRDLQFAAERSQIGKKHRIDLLRDGKAMSVELVPAELPAEFSVAKVNDPAANGAPSNRTEMTRSGLEVAELTPEIAARLGMADARGVVISRVESGSAAQQAGLQPGMVIVQINGTDVTTVDACRAALEQGNEDPLLLIRTSQGSRFVVLNTSTRG
jgi:serine protease Do